MPIDSASDPIAAIRKAVRGMANALPVILAVVGLLGLFRSDVSRSQLQGLFTGRQVTDVLVGTTAGSVSTGNALTSYIIGGELLDMGVSLLAVTAFLVAWVTVGVIQFPAESDMLGRRFALVRNVTSPLLAVVVAVDTVWTVGALP